MNIKELKEIIADLPDEMMVGLLDSSTDDPDDMNYSLSKDNFSLEDYFDPEDEWNDSGNYGKPKGKMLFITFANTLNDNPI